MQVRTAAVALTIVGALATASYAKSPSVDDIRRSTGAIDGNAIVGNLADTKNWLSYGLGYDEKRFSKLKQINADNVGKLGLAWTHELNTRRGIEATPLVVDGVMYLTGPWSIVFAIDVRSGKRLWTYDPKVPRSIGIKGCCDVVNRGAALWKGKVYSATFDGRLIALDAATGKLAWEVDTINDRSRPYTVTGAVRVFNGKVIIGNGGAEYGVRGYITAFDAETGKQLWRWFSVPGDPSKPYEDESMARAAATWDPAGKYWELGGGGTMWDSIVFDPELNLMYVGVGNGAPWNRDIRSPGGGDNLYLNSIVALNPDTGAYKWHYQETPGDHWDYTSVQTIILADLNIDGRDRKVLLHAPKNGFFYVVDRVTGQFISAKNFVKVTWAKGYDANGRPIETPAARDKVKPWETVPSAFGAHSWHPMSFSPETGLAYIPAQGIPLVHTPEHDFKFNEMKGGKHGSHMGINLGFKINDTPPKEKAFGRLIAWDPVKQREVWSHEYPSPWNGGTLVTAGNVVFQGTADARFVAYNAATGKKLWETPVGSGAVSGPVTYELDGEQYVSIAVGWGGVYGKFARASKRAATGRVYTFKIGGTAKPPKDVMTTDVALVAGHTYDKSLVDQGGKLYGSACAQCHGTPGGDSGAVPNLGYTSKDNLDNLAGIVLTGALAEGGMPNYKGKLTEQEVTAIAAYIQATVDAARK